jgi:hypothetical protein
MLARPGAAASQILYPLFFASVPPRFNALLMGEQNLKVDFERGQNSEVPS